MIMSHHQPAEQNYNIQFANKSKKRGKAQMLWEKW
jgi:hypothetical protein